MRKISAHYILPVSGSPLRNGIVMLDENGTILELKDTGGRLRETEKLEFYNGIITPGFVLPLWRFQQYQAKRSPAYFQDLDSWLRLNGVSGVGLIQTEGTHFKEKRYSPIQYHTIIEICPEPGNDFDAFHSTLSTIVFAWNEYEQSCSISCCPESWFGSELPGYILEYISTHRSVFTLRQDSDHPLDAQINALNKTWNRINEGNQEKTRNLPGHLLLTGIKRDIPRSMEMIDVPGLTKFYFSAFPGPEQDKAWVHLLKSIFQDKQEERSFEDVLKTYTLEAAQALFEEDTLGSIEPGKRPGLNLIAPVEILSGKRIRLMENSTLKML
jgi:hypothetical protein